MKAFFKWIFKKLVGKGKKPPKPPRKKPIPPKWGGLIDLLKKQAKEAAKKADDAYEYALKNPEDDKAWKAFEKAMEEAKKLSAEMVDAMHGAKGN